IGGITAALALARSGIRVVLFEAAPRLEEVGAGIQLSPNASRVLVGLGLADRLKPHVVTPEELIVHNARTGGTLARAPLGAPAAQRHGAPSWVVHRRDLQPTLVDAVSPEPPVTLAPGTRIEDFATHGHGITIAAVRDFRSVEERCMALVAADGLWSVLRRRLGHRTQPRFARHVAWRTLVPANAVPPDFAAPAVNLWLGSRAHLVHYPVKSGRMINVVAILRAYGKEPGCPAAGSRAELPDRFPPGMWHAPAHELLKASAQWQKWALYDCPPFRRWGKGPVTLLGDAAHPMLPYLAQGAAMAIEDAAVLGACLARSPDDPAGAMHASERRRVGRTARTQRAARRNGAMYHLGGAAGLLRTLALLAVGGGGLLKHYDWLYGWEPP